MARTRRHIPLRVLLNDRLVGHMMKDTSGAIEFRYSPSWVGAAQAIPVSLSMPIREDPYKGQVVSAVFENLLPDSDVLRNRVAEKVGANGTDAYSLLSEIGRDCVGALQFLPDDAPNEPSNSGIEGRVLGDTEIEALLKNLTQAPLGLSRDQDFRISVAGAQEKTSLLLYDGKWLKPYGTTPTTHLFKTQIGSLPNGLDLSNSIENEYYCLKLLSAFGLPVNAAEIMRFGTTKALVIERFDRKWSGDGRLLRLPMEDCCQALSISPSRKYQAEGGPGMADILKLLSRSDVPAEDQTTFVKAQILFSLIGATDGHAKNFSVFLGPEGRFRMAPIYDVLTAQPSLDTKQIHEKQMKMAMFVGDKRHYVMEYIERRHFVQTVERAGLPNFIANNAFQEIEATVKEALTTVALALPAEFPAEIHESVTAALLSRLSRA
jgi:serine/threonine-protein kinase HipA